MAVLSELTNLEDSNQWMLLLENRLDRIISTLSETDKVLRLTGFVDYSFDNELHITYHHPDRAYVD